MTGAHRRVVMDISTRGKGITFAVHPVTQAKELLPTCKTRDGLSKLLATVNESAEEPVISCSGYNSNCLANVGIHPLFAAVHIAFSQHYPLVLSPDMIW